MVYGKKRHTTYTAGRDSPKDVFFSGRGVRWGRPTWGVAQVAMMNIPLERDSVKWNGWLHCRAADMWVKLCQCTRELGSELYLT